MKKSIWENQFDGDNKVEILECIRKNRLILIQETFRNKSDMYADFANRIYCLRKNEIVADFGDII